MGGCVGIWTSVQWSTICWFTLFWHKLSISHMVSHSLAYLQWADKTCPARCFPFLRCALSNKCWLSLCINRLLGLWNICSGCRAESFSFFTRLTSIVIITRPRPKAGGRVLKCGWFVFICRRRGVELLIGSRPLITRPDWFAASWRVRFFWFRLSSLFSIE